MCDNLFKYNSGSTPSHTIPKMVIDNQPPGHFSRGIGGDGVFSFQESFVHLCGADAILTLLSLLFREITRFHPDPGMEKVKERRSPICHGRTGAVTPPCLLRFGHQKN